MLGSAAVKAPSRHRYRVPSSKSASVEVTVGVSVAGAVPPTMVIGTTSVGAALVDGHDHHLARIALVGREQHVLVSLPPIRDCVEGVRAMNLL